MNVSVGHGTGMMEVPHVPLRSWLLKTRRPSAPGQAPGKLANAYRSLDSGDASLFRVTLWQS